MEVDSKYMYRMCVCFFRLQLEGDGTYECSVTGLVFEANEQVLVRYSVLSWSKFGAFLPNSWKCAGPIFNVDTVSKPASVLKSIQFPHSVCLARKGIKLWFDQLKQRGIERSQNLIDPLCLYKDPEDDIKFGVLHIKDNRPLIEPSSDISGNHIKWNVSSLSPVGPILQTNRAVEHHGVVLVYKQLCSDANYSFHIYLATNSASDIKVSVASFQKAERDKRGASWEFSLYGSNVCSFSSRHARPIKQNCWKLGQIFPNSL